MFNSTNSVPSVADMAAVMGNRNSDGFADGNGWWVLIILFAIFGGWGNGAWGNNGGYGTQSAAGYTDAAIQRGFDNQSVMNKLNGLENGICSLGYDQLSQMNGINTNIAQTGYNLQNSIQQNAIAQMQNTNSVQSQISQCCCDNREAIAGVNYNLATDTCAITTAINQAAQNTIENANSNYRALHDEFVQSQIDAKNEKIAEQQATIQALNLAASQQAQNNYIVNQLRPYPVPAYYMANPWAGTNTCMTGCCGNS